MYHGRVKTVTITIPPELDAQAAAEAKRRGISKSELIRQGLQAVLSGSSPGPVGTDDPWRALAGFGSPGVHVEPGEIDEIAYGS